MLEQVAEQLNCLGDFCALRDLPALTGDCLQRRYGFRQVDVMVLFGGSILCGGDLLARAMQDRVARTYVIVGGAGHTTPALLRQIAAALPGLETEGLSEAEAFDRYLRGRYGLQADLLECQSTNCGNNITNLLELLRREGVAWQSILLMQDGTMQQRMDAGMRKYAPEKTILNFAAYRAQVTVRQGKLAYRQPIAGMWEMDRYTTLLMGEIPRLTDDAAGYGPRGLGYIAHVEVPPRVTAAFAALQREYGARVRPADPRFASDPGADKTL